VQGAFKKLQSDVQLTTDVNIGDYATTLEYSQSGLPTATDDSLDYILPVLAKPIVQKIVSGTGLGYVNQIIDCASFVTPYSIETVIISDPKQDSFGKDLLLYSCRL
jgi:hypothetical protein